MAGPPRWHPDKTPCPPIVVEERERLLNESIPLDSERPDSTRYAFRVGTSGFEWFAARFTRWVEGEAEFHGHPTDYVPARVLRRFRDLGRLSDRDYRQLVKKLG